MRPPNVQQTNQTNTTSGRDNAPGHVDAMVGDAILGKVVRANAVGTVASADLRPKGRKRIVCNTAGSQVDRPDVGEGRSKGEMVLGPRWPRRGLWLSGGEPHEAGHAFSKCIRWLTAEALRQFERNSQRDLGEKHDVGPSMLDCMHFISRTPTSAMRMLDRCSMSCCRFWLYSFARSSRIALALFCCAKR